MIISVASGKGGTGKTTIATNLARVLSEDAPVTLMDADVEEPNDHVFLGISFAKRENVCLLSPVIDESKCSHCRRCEEICVHNAIMVTKKAVLVFPEICHACGGCALLCPAGAISEEARPIGVLEFGTLGRLHFAHGKLNPGEVFSPNVIRSLKKHVAKNGLTLIDCPPGTSCPAVQALKDSDLCVLVTEPTPFGLHDLTLAVEMLEKMRIPMAVVVNRYGLGNQEVERYCEQRGLPVIAKLPFDRQVAECYARGKLVADALPAWKQIYRELARKIMDVAGASELPRGGEVIA